MTALSQSAREVAELWRELCALSTTAFYDAGEQPNDPEGIKQSAIADAAVAKTLSDAIAAAEQRGALAERERAAGVSEKMMHGVSPQITARFGVDAGIYKQHNDACNAIAHAIRTGAKP